jgi:hypothetical protein
MGLADRDYMKDRRGELPANVDSGAGSWTTHGAAPVSGSMRAVLSFAAVFIVAVFAIYLLAPERPSFGGKPLPFPANGVVAYPAGAASRATAQSFQLLDAAGDGNDRVVRFRDPADNALVAELYLRSGKQAQVWLRPGPYRIHIMQGRNWLGPDVHFGRDSMAYDHGAHVVGGAFAGIRLLGESVVGNAQPIPRSAF